MTPIQDYAFADRQRLINTKDTLAQRRNHYRYLIGKGHSEQASTNASGYHPFDEPGFGIAVRVCLVCIAAVLLALWVNSSHALMDARDDAKSGKESDRALVSCLNGGEMLLSDGTRWMCLKMGMEK